MYIFYFILNSLLFSNSIKLFVGKYYVSTINYFIRSNTRVQLINIFISYSYDFHKYKDHIGDTDILLSTIIVKHDIA